MKKTPKKSNPSASVLFRAKRGKRTLNLADHKLWTQVTETVAPLDPKVRANVVLPQPEAVTVKADPPPPPRRPKKPTQAAPSAPAPVTTHRPDQTALHHGTTPGIDKRTAQKFKKGKMAIEGRLDLHGHTQHHAHVSLRRFISDAYASDKRCVIVVTGKGRRSAEGGPSIGVLRASVPRWLNEPGLREKILSFSHAGPSDGGEGALYVLLKRKRGG